MVASCSGVWLTGEDAGYLFSFVRSEALPVVGRSYVTIWSCSGPHQTLARRFEVA